MRTSTGFFALILLGILLGAVLMAQTPPQSPLVNADFEMNNRPITLGTWFTCEISGDVASDASNISLGLLMRGTARAWIGIAAGRDEMLERAIQAVR